MTDHLPALPDPSAVATVSGADVLAAVQSATALMRIDDLCPELGDEAQRLAALASAAHRAKLGAEAELDWSEAARTVERRLGQLLDEGRAAGTVAGRGGDPSTKVDRSTLPDLHVSRDMAADAAAMACLDDDQWRQLVERGRQGGTLHRGAMAKAARDWLAEIKARADQIEREREDAEAQLERARRQADEAKREQARVRARVAALVEQLVPPPAPTVAEPDLAPFAHAAEPDLTTASAAETLPDHRSTTAHLAAHERLLQRVIGIVHALEEIAGEPLVERAETDDMLLNGLRSSVGRIVESAHLIAHRYNDHLGQPPQLRRIK